LHYDALRQTISRAVSQGTLGLACGKDANQFDRVWFKEAVELPDVTFDYETYLLTAKKAKALKEAGAEPPTGKPPTPPTKPPVVTPPVEPPPGQPPGQPPTKPQSSVVCWQGQLKREQWNLFSLRVLTRLAKAEDVEIEVKVKAKLKEAQTIDQLNAALRELGISELRKSKSPSSDSRKLGESKQSPKSERSPAHSNMGCGDPPP
jgi:hypothetical protein